MSRSFLKALGALLLFFSNAQLSASDYYWVGGKGSWSDISHWSATSGGIPSYTVIPGPNDDVFFDGNSFNSPSDTVFVPLVSNCKDFSYQSIYDVIFQRTDVAIELRITGDLSLREGAVFNFPLFIVSTNYTNQLDIKHTKLRGLTFLGNGQWTIPHYFETSSIIVQSGKLLVLADSLRVGYLGSNAQHGVTKVCIQIESKILYLQSVFIDNDSILAENTEIFGLSDLNTNYTCYVRLGRVHTFATYKQILFRVQGANIQRLYCEEQDFYFSSWTGQVDTLTIHAGRRVEFGSGTYEIGRIEANGTCTRPVRFIGLSQIGSTIQGVQSSSVNYATFRYLNFSTPIQVTSSVNSLGNSGITFLASPSASTYFWIGGRGNYSDPSHWSYASGGSSAGCIPNEGDTVVFDANSFIQADTVFYDQQIYVGGMRILNDKVFFSDPSSPLNSFNIHGDFYASKPIPGLQRTILMFYLNKDAKMECSGTNLESIELCASNKELKVIDNHIYARQVRIVNGILNLDNRTLTCQVFVTSAIQTIAISMVNATINAKFFTMDVGTGTLSSAGSKVYVTENFTAFGVNVFLPFVYLRPDHERTVLATIEYAKVGKLQIAASCRLWTADGECDTLLVEEGGHLLVQNYTGTFKVINRFEALGTCTNRVRLSEGAFTFLSTTQLVFDYVDFYDVSMFGKSGIVANNSALMHFCSGFNVTKSANSMYWIGGQGNWFDPSHWSNQSGGAAQACIPDYYDTVIFDENSLISNFDTIFFTGTRTPVAGFLDISALTKKAIFAYHDNTSNGHEFLIQFGSVLGSNFEAKRGIILKQVGGTGSNFRFTDYEAGPLTLSLNGNGAHHILGNLDSFSGVYANNGETILDLDDTYIKWISVGIDGQFAPTSNYPRAKLVVNNPISIYNIEFTAFGIGQLDADSVSFYCVRRFFDRRNAKSPFKLLKFVAENESDSFLKNLEFYGYASIDARSIEMKRNYLHSANMALRTDSLFVHGAKLINMHVGSSMEINNYFYAHGNNCYRVLFKGFGTPTIISQSALFNCDHLIFENVQAIGAANFLAGTYSQLSGNTGNWIQGSNPNLVSRYGGQEFVGCNDSFFIDLFPFYGAADSLRLSNGSRAMQSWIKDTGTYYIQAFYDAGCRVFDTFRFQKARAPEALLGNDTLLCGEDSFPIRTLESFNSPWSKSWSTNSNQDSLLVTNSGTYWFEVSQPGCVFRDSIDVYLGKRFSQPLITRDTFACSGDSIPIRIQQAITYDVVWNDQVTGYERYLHAPGNYTYIIADSSCQSYDSISVKPVNIRLKILGDTLFCEGDSIRLNANTISGIFSWADGSNQNSKWVKQSGDFILTRQDSGCTAIDTQAVVMHVVPTIQILGDLTLCEGDSTELQIQTNATSWEWIDGHPATARWIKQDGNYHVQTTNPICNSRDSATIQMTVVPELNFNDTVLCPNEPLYMDLSFLPNGIDVYLNGILQTDSLTLRQPGNYSISVRQLNCENEDSFSLDYFAPISYELVDSVDLCSLTNQTFILSLDTPYLFFWNDIPLFQEEITVRSSGIQIVRIEDENGCSEIQSIHFDPCACELYFPNAITVNQDGNNEVFKGEGCSEISNYNLKIFSRWGELVFESEDANASWDGTYGGEVCQEGVYLYLVSYNNLSEFGVSKRFQVKGTLTLLH